MSADLESFQDLAKIKLPKLRIQSSNENGIVTEEENKNQDDSSSSSSSISKCLTPTSEESKIPTVLSCPPAPRKPRKRAISCKRKLQSELESFEIVNREEVDAFFKAAGFDDSISKRS
ncbi:hypothetical protein PTKIN_Ptkin13bG0204400 [Pterospermum kingtungense]